MIRSARLLPLALGLAPCWGCYATGAPVRALSSEPPTLPARVTKAARAAAPWPRIGAPGGAGAGQRSVLPPQSGNDAVGGLAAGSGKSGRRG